MLQNSQKDIGTPGSSFLETTDRRNFVESHGMDERKGYQPGDFVLEESSKMEKFHMVV